MVAETAVLVKATVAAVATVAGTVATVMGQQQQADAAKATAEFNAELARLDIEQNIRNRKIEATNDRRVNYIREQKNINKLGLTSEGYFDIMYADKHAFEYEQLVKDYNVAQINTTLDARRRGTIYKGDVTASNLQTASVGTALGGIADAASIGNTSGGSNVFAEYYAKK
mgnify:CR=1 FL=1